MGWKKEGTGRVVIILQRVVEDVGLLVYVYNQL